MTSCSHTVGGVVGERPHAWKPVSHQSSHKYDFFRPCIRLLSFTLRIYHRWMLKPGIYLKEQILLIFSPITLLKPFPDSPCKVSAVIVKMWGFVHIWSSKKNYNCLSHYIGFSFLKETFPQRLIITLFI